MPEPLRHLTSGVTSGGPSRFLGMTPLARLVVLLLALAVGLAAVEPSGAAPPHPGKKDKARSTTGDWAQFRGPGGSGFSADKGINKDWKANPPKELWRIPLNKGFAGPAVANGAVFIIDHEGDQDLVRGLRLADGTEGWRSPYPDPGQDSNGYARSTPAIDQGRVYVVSRKGQVHCLDAKTGAPVWEAKLFEQFGGRQVQMEYSVSPIVDGNAVILVPGGDQGTVLALDKATGRKFWQGGGNDNAGYATPLVATIGGVRQYVVFTAKNLIGVEAINGKLLWSFPFSTPNDINATTPLLCGEAVFITASYGAGCALVEITGGQAKARWQNRDFQGHFNAPVLHRGFIYGTTDPHNLMCLDAQTGAVKWKADGGGKGGVAAIEDVMVVEDSNTGEVLLVKLTPDAYTELGRIKPFTAPHMQYFSPPIIADKKLVVRDQTNLVCYDLR
jgi:outer membrane protein assembly factor BamB